MVGATALRKIQDPVGSRMEVVRAQEVGPT